MKESYVEGLAAHGGPESCVAVRKGRGEALTGVRAGRVLSRERKSLRGADAVEVCGRLHPAHRNREMRRNPARSKTPCMYGNTSRENREVPCPPATDSACTRLACGYAQAGTHADRGAAGRVGKSKDIRR